MSWRILSVALTLTAVSANVSARAVEFGAPDYSNYMSRPGLVVCNWQYPSYWHACPTPDIPPKPAKAEPVTSAGKGKAKAKKS